MSINETSFPGARQNVRVLLLVALGVVLSLAVLAGWLLGWDGTSQSGRRELHGWRARVAADA